VNPKLNRIKYNFEDFIDKNNLKYPLQWVVFNANLKSFGIKLKYNLFKTCNVSKFLMHREHGCIQIFG
jgi:hypothetical protein